MKTYFILLALVLSAVISYGQASKNFIYTPSKEREGRYIVSPSFEEPRNEALKTRKSQIAYVRTYEFGKLLFPQGFFSMVKSAVSSEKLTQLRKLQETDKWKRMGISFKYSGSGKFYGLSFFLEEEHLEILDDEDLYAIYKVFEEYTPDMSKVDLDTDNGSGGYEEVEKTDEYRWDCFFILKIPQD